MRLLALAFRDNPLNRAAVRGSPRRRLRANAHGMRASLPVAAASGALWWARRAGRPLAVMIATPPNDWPLPAPGALPQLRSLLGQGLRTTLRWARVFDELASLHPPLPHWYISTLGVEADSQGRGIGSTLLAEWLQRSGACDQRVALETDRAENVRFYQRAGFETAGEASVLGVRIWLLRRRPSHERRPPGER